MHNLLVRSRHQPSYGLVGVSMIRAYIWWLPIVCTMAYVPRVPSKLPQDRKPLARLCGDSREREMGPLRRKGLLDPVFSSFLSRSPTYDSQWLINMRHCQCIMGYSRLYRPLVLSYLAFQVHSHDYLDLQKSPNNGPISQNREYRQHYFGHFGGPGM